MLFKRLVRKKTLEFFDVIDDELTVAEESWNSKLIPSTINTNPLLRFLLLRSRFSKGRIS
jgi:hypothetical protein